MAEMILARRCRAAGRAIEASRMPQRSIIFREHFLMLDSYELLRGRLLCTSTRRCRLLPLDTPPRRRERDMPAMPKDANAFILEPPFRRYHRRISRRAPRRKRRPTLMRDVASVRAGIARAVDDAS